MPWSSEAIVGTGLYSVRPGDIKENLTASDLPESFGWAEAEKVAALIVRLCQLRKTWRPFEIEDLIRSDVSQNEIIRGLDKLVRGDWVEKAWPLFAVTKNFIDQCLKKAPAK